jgi:hypothetical protein
VRLIAFPCLSEASGNVENKGECYGLRNCAS